MSRKSIEQFRFTVGKNRHTLFDNIEVSVDKIRHKVSQTLSSYDHIGKNKSKSRQSQRKQPKNTSKPKTKRSLDSKIRKNIKDQKRNSKNKSINKHHRTEIEQQQQDKELQSEITKIKQKLLFINSPKGKIQQIIQYYKQIDQVIQNVHEQTLQSLLLLMHKMYTSHLSQLFKSVHPYQNLLLRKRQIQQQISVQLNKNNELSQQLASFDELKEIERLNEIIESQRRHDEISKVQTTMPSIHVQSKKQQKDFKINLKSLQENKIVGYHDEFMSKLPDMSESWRQQALRQKRY